MLRWWTETIAKSNMVARSNDHCCIPERWCVTNESRAGVMGAGNLEKMADPNPYLSLRFKAAFGLQREESLKICPAIADCGKVLALQVSWTVGGRVREKMIRFEEWRAVLANAKTLVG